MPKLYKSLLCVVLLLAPALAFAQVLLIDGVAQAEAVQRPSSGMSMDRVENTFGAPRQKLQPVGVPPISRWVYDHYTVYFEYDRVVHSVVHKNSE